MNITREQLIKAVLSWWNEHQYNTISIPCGDGYCEEHNLYDEEPEFVRIAKELNESN